MKIIKILIPLLLLCSCQEGSLKTVEIDEFMKALEDPDLILVDVRTAKEHADGCIPGTAYNIDVLEDNFTEKALEMLPAHSKLAIYCRSGNRSKKAGQILSENGYQVIELGSGFKGWQKWSI